MKGISKRINKLIEDAGISVEMAAGLTGIDRKRLGEIIAGVTEVTVCEVASIARAFNASKGEIIYGRGTLHRVRGRPGLR